MPVIGTWSAWSGELGQPRGAALLLHDDNSDHRVAHLDGARLGSHGPASLLPITSDDASTATPLGVWLGGLVPRSKEKNQGVPVPAHAKHLRLEEAATLLRTTVNGVVHRIRREQIPPCCVIQPKKGGVILLHRAKLEKHCLGGDS